MPATKSLIDLATRGRIFDLGQPYFPGMPHHPSHPPFLFGLVKKHGDYVSKCGASSASESISLGGHVGTHIDGFGHFSCGGKLFGGFAVEQQQTYSDGLSVHAISGVPPIVRRGVLLDVAGHFHLDALPEGFAISPQQIEEICEHQHVEINAGDVVLLRTGWAKYWRDPQKFITAGTGGQVTGPGPELPAAEWLSQRRVFAAGSDTVAFEKVPDANMPVHVHLLVEKGIHIVECLNLEELASAEVYEFLFTAAPMKIEGGTGAPVRPIAIAASA